MSNSNKLKVLITHPEVATKALDILKQKFDLTISKGYPFPSRNQILNDIKGASGVLWAVCHKFDQEMIDAAGPNLKVVSTKSAGYDHINVPLLKSFSIICSNTPGVVSNPTAEIAVALLLATARRLQEGYQAIIRGQWEVGRIQWMLGRSLENSTVGIVGLGGIGCSVAKKLRGFDVKRILYSGHNEKPAGKSLECEFVSQDYLLQESDFIIISCTFTEETKNLFNRETFKKMKPSSILINVSRGGVVDQEALLEALINKTIWGAGLDVMTPEPLPHDHPLTKLPNCVLAPHLGTATERAEEDMAVLAAQNIYNALNNLPLLTPIL